MGKTHVVDGKKYVEVERVAKVGEKIIVTTKGNGWYDEKIGEIYEVIDGKAYGFDILELRDSEYAVYVENGKNSNSCISFVEDEHYNVLESVESEETPDINDLIANLARRVSSLEQQLRDTQGNVEKLAEELANTKHRVSKHATMFGAVEERVETLTSDIITLDERSQVLNAINKFYEEGSR
jgi:predicted RNase H-like nuclease (RuvC/YqgF family)